MIPLRARLVLCVPLAVAVAACFFVEPVPGDKHSTIAGTVSDEREPVAGAHVRIAGEAQFAVTDALGRFRLRQPTPLAGSRLITAATPGHFIAFEELKNRTRLTLRSLPGEDHADYGWVDPHPGAMPFSCGSCHREVFDEWKSSAHGGRSRFNEFFAQISREYPEGTAVCASCHDPAPLEKERERSSHIHCDFCHKVSGPGKGDIGLTHGKFGLELLRPANGQLIFGPLDDSPRRENAFSPFQRDVRLCASCHEGVVFGVRVYETYSEWRGSPAGRAGTQCQECHMRPTGKMTNVAKLHGGLERDPMTLANHHFFDGSQLDMLRRSLKLSLEVKRDGPATQVVVEVRADDVGHRVPTGSPDRNLALIVEGFDAAGKAVRPSAGPTLPEFADKERRAGRLFAKVLRDWQGKKPVPFWRASPEFEDTRLQPGRAERVEMTFPASAATIKARLVYRRHWGDAEDVIKEVANRP